MSRLADHQERRWIGCLDQGFCRIPPRHLWIGDDIGRYPFSQVEQGMFFYILRIHRVQSRGRAFGAEERGELEDVHRSQGNAQLPGP